jgi:TetR/AcrR family transcriptional repressor of nem operon
MTASRSRTESGTAERALDIAERLVQMRGFSNFSYADIATELGITKASLHYHYPGKAELGQALVTRYADLYAGVLRNERMCMCGILAAEYQTLPAAMQSEVIRFFDDNQKWLAKVLKDGKAEGTLAYTGRPSDIAQSVLSTLEGAMLVARPYGDLTRFDAAAKQLLRGLTP